MTEEKRYCKQLKVYKDGELVKTWKCDYIIVSPDFFADELVQIYKDGIQIGCTTSGNYGYGYWSFEEVKDNG